MALPRRDVSISGESHLLRRQHSGLSSASTACSSEGEEQPLHSEYVPSRKSDQAMIKVQLEKELQTKSAISILQEFVQCSKDFQLPPRQPILRWHYETRIRDQSTLEFQSRAVFLIGGALHHSVGGWQLSKKLAQRDAAERAVAFFVVNWCDVLVEESKSRAQGTDSIPVNPDARAITSSFHEVQLLDQYSRRFQADDDANSWHEIHDENQWQALVDIDISGVPHKFAGPKCPNRVEAYRQTAKRVLWYLQHPDYVHSFEPDVDVVPAAMSAPPPNWTFGQSTEESQQVVQRKTAVMRIQNRLQQRLGYDLKPGQSVWQWSYETDGKVWPPLVRATVRLAVSDIEFTGDWIRSHRGAQLDTCSHVEQYLNTLDN